jgi:hypothetical protein
MTPRATLTAWEQWSAASDRFEETRVRLGTALGKREWDALPPLAEAVCRLILVEPARAPLELGPAFVSVEELVFALRPVASRADVPGSALLALLDLVNALSSIGPIQPTADVIVCSWLRELAGAQLAEADRLRVGFAALSLEEAQVARAIAGAPPTGKVDYDGSQMFHDWPGVLRNFIGALQQDPNKSLYKRGSFVLPLFGRVIDRLGEDDVAATTLMWMARITFRDIMDKPPRELPAHAHALIWDHVAEQEAEAAAGPQSAAPIFPVGATFANGAIRVEHVLRGTGMQKLCSGRDPTTNAQLLIAWDACRQRASVDELRAAAGARAPGMFELVYAGRTDTDPSYWGVVERVPQGSWLPSVLPPQPDPDTAIRLVRSAGALLAQAAEHGVVLAHVRPEYMWAEQTSSGLQVTGVSARGYELFSRKGYELVTHPLFARDYHAPEHAGSVDDRALVFALAAMLVEWAGGAPASIDDLLARASRPDREQRPRLAEFLAALR